MSTISEWIYITLGINDSHQAKIAGSLLVCFIVWGIRRLLLSVIRKRSDDIRVQYRWRKVSSYVAFFLILLIVGRIWHEGISTFSTFLGLLSAGIAIAMKDPLMNIAGWGYLMWAKPFEIEDRIEIGEHSGDVLDIQISQFTMMETGNWVDAEQSTGRILHIPNSFIFTHSLANYTKGFPFIWEEIPVLITFESNWERAKEILREILEEQTASVSNAARDKIKSAARKHMIFYRKLTPIVYTSTKDSGILLTMRFLCDPRQRRGKAHTLWEEILRAFAKHKDIDLAYPTIRYFDHVKEGKQAV